LDSPAANAAFAKQIGLTFPLLSDMNRKMLKTYGILKGYNVQDETYEWLCAPTSLSTSRASSNLSKRATAPSIPTPL